MPVPLRWLFLLILPVIWPAVGVSAVAAKEPQPRYGMALLAGQSYDPDRFGLVILQGSVQLPYAQVFWHAAPDSLFFKGEFNLGLTTDGRDRGLAAINMMAVKYLHIGSFGNFSPYLEGGIGLIYTDFRVKGQGLRINFNPQIGAGMEYPLKNGKTISVGLRLHHLSNADLHADNRGVNSMLLLTGVRF